MVSVVLMISRVGWGGVEWSVCVCVCRGGGGGVERWRGKGGVREGEERWVG